MLDDLAGIRRAHGHHVDIGRLDESHEVVKDGAADESDLGNDLEAERREGAVGVDPGVAQHLAHCLCPCLFLAGAVVLNEAVASWTVVVSL
jgi:hypothetical protein